jgi:hypothetical protein
MGPVTGLVNTIETRYNHESSCNLEKMEWIVLDASQQGCISKGIRPFCLLNFIHFKLFFIVASERSIGVVRWRACAILMNGSRLIPVLGYSLILQLYFSFK